MPATDHYEVLGLSPDAGPAEWKKAYRRLAMRWHPDRNADPGATERFKAINAAYEALVSGDDEVSDASDDEATAPADETSAEPARAPDIRLNLELTLPEGATGCRRKIRYTRGKACPRCNGSGEAGMARTRFCSACHGSGRVRDAARVLVACGECHGRGFFSERICPDCEGSGRETEAVELEINVPPGMLPGDELRLAGQGESGDGELLPGHLFLTIVLRSHPLFQLTGRDIHYGMPVSVLALLAGGTIELCGLTGKLSHQLSAGTADRRDIRLKGLGYPGRGKKSAGDLVVELLPSFPERLDARQRKLLLQADAALMGNLAETLPTIAAWRRDHGLDA